MANRYSGFRRGNAAPQSNRPAPVELSTIKVPTAPLPKGASWNKQVFETVKDADGNELGRTPAYPLNCVYGTVLAVNEHDKNGEVVTDRHNRQYVGVIIEIAPGDDRLAQTADPALQAILLGLKPGEKVYTHGKLQRNASGFGAHQRIQEIAVYNNTVTPGSEAAASVAGPKLVESSAA